MSGGVKGPREQKGGLCIYPHVVPCCVDRERRSTGGEHRRGDAYFISVGWWWEDASNIKIWYIAAKGNSFVRWTSRSLFYSNPNLYVAATNTYQMSVLH